MPSRVIHIIKALILAAWFGLAISPSWGQADSGAVALEIGPGIGSRNLSSALAYFEDAGGQLDVEVVARQWPTAELNHVGQGDAATLGYSDSAYWFRLPLRLSSAASWWLEVGYPSLDSVELYVPKSGGGFAKYSASDHQPFSQRAYPHRNFVFPIELPAGETALYLRVKSEGTLTIPIVLWEPAAFHRHNPPQYALFALYYGTLLALGLYNLMLYFAIRERVYLEYVLFVVSMAIGQASLNGFGNQFVWSEWPAWGNLALPVGFSAAGVFGTLFIRSFLGTRLAMPKADRAMLAIVGLFAIAISATPLAYRWGSLLTSVGGLSISILACTVAIASYRRGHPSARYLLIAWTILLVGVGVMAARNMGWLPANFFTTYILQIGSALEMLLLSFALADRINIMRREKEQANSEALAIKQQMVEALQRSERLLEQRVAERTHELAEANACLRDNEETLLQMARQDALTGLANRIALDEELERAVKRAERHGNGLAALVIDLDGFKPINDGHGHAVGDSVLREVAGRLRACVRASDLVCRFGGDEFVILLEGARIEQDACAVAEKLLAAMGEPVAFGAERLHVSASIGIALYPGGGAMPWDLIAKADDAMYEAKRSGGRRYCIKQLAPGGSLPA